MIIFDTNMARLFGQGNEKVVEQVSKFDARDILHITVITHIEIF